MNKIISIVFWILVSVIVFLLFGSASENYIYSFYFLTFFIPLAILTSWIFTSVLIPRFLLKKKFKLFFLYSFYVLIVSLDLELIVVFVAFILFSFYDYENLNAIIDIYKWMPVFMYLMVLLVAFFKLVREVFKVQNTSNNADDISHIVIRSERKNKKLKLSEVVYIESMSDYLKIYMNTGENVITREKISSLSNKLPDNFIRIHRSFIISLAHLDSYSKESITITGKELPISRTYKKEVLERLLNF